MKLLEYYPVLLIKYFKLRNTNILNHEMKSQKNLRRNKKLTGRGLGSVAALDVVIKVAVLPLLVEQQTVRAELLDGHIVPAVDVVGAALGTGELTAILETARWSLGLSGLRAHGWL